MNDDRFISYAQNLEDVMLWRALSTEVSAQDGFYIDVGASDPSLLSVTRAFYDRGWHGVNIEPLPEQATALRRARKRDVVVQAALGAAPGQQQFHRVVASNQTGLSTLDSAEAARHQAAGATVDTIEVEITTLAAICREHVSGPVHFLKIDAEGAEADVLAGADFTLCRPWILLIEATHPLDSTPADVPWEAGLLAAGYQAVWFDGLNRFYLANEHTRLARHFRAPPNVFDRYVVHDGPLADHIAATESLAATRLELIEQLESDLARLNAPDPQSGQRQTTGTTLLAAPPVPPPTAPVEPPEPPPPPPRHSLPRRLVMRVVMLVYGLVRPIARPLVWRARTFLTGHILTELEGHRIRLDQLIARPVAVPPVSDPALPAAMERLLLTLALEDGRDPGPASLYEPRAEPLSNPAPPR